VEPREPWAQKVTPAPWGLKDLPDPWDHKAHKAHKVPKVFPDLKGLKVRQGLKGY